jgi:CspA family cold shock protein
MIVEAVQAWPQRRDKVPVMAATTGTIKRKTDKGFGFIAAADGTEYFFHQSGCVGTRFDDLREGQRVSFTVGQGPKGPRAENVKPE